MLEFLEGVSVIRVGVTDDVAYKGGIFVAKFSNAVQVFYLPQQGWGSPHIFMKIEEKILKQILVDEILKKLKIAPKD